MNNKAYLNNNTGFYSSGATELSYIVSCTVHNMIKYYMSKFKRGHFKHIHKAKSHVLREYKKKDINSRITKVRPVIAVNYRINLKEQQLFDSYFFTRQMGAIGLSDRDLNDFTQSIIYDKEHNVRLNFTTNYININMEFTHTYDTEMQQLETFWFMMPVFSLDPLQEEFYIKFAIPERYVNCIAKNMGYVDINDSSFKPLEFVSKLNKYTLLPITYEMCTGTGTYRYFVTAKTIYLIRCNKPDIDEGQEKGTGRSNFRITHTLECDVMAPNMWYLMYKDEKWHPDVNDDKRVNVDKISVSTIKYDWLEHMDGDNTVSGYSGLEFSEDGETGTIDIREIMMDDIYNAYLKLVDKGVQISKLLSVKVYKNRKIYESPDVIIDVDNYTVTIKNGTIEDEYALALYVNLETLKMTEYEVYNETDEYITKS